MTYTFTAASPGTRSYYSGTQGDLQVEMGLYGAIIVLPKTGAVRTARTGSAAANVAAEAPSGENDFRLAASAYDHPTTCYDREYLFQFSEMDPSIHTQAEAQVTARQLRGRLTRMQSQCSDRAVSPGLLPDQRPLDAG